MSFEEKTSVMYYGSVRVRIMNLRWWIVREAVYLWRVRGGNGGGLRRPALFRSRGTSQGNNTKCAYVTSSLCGSHSRSPQLLLYFTFLRPALQNTRFERAATTFELHNKSLQESRLYPRLTLLSHFTFTGVPKSECFYSDLQILHSWNEFVAQRLRGLIRKHN